MKSNHFLVRLLPALLIVISLASCGGGQPPAETAEKLVVKTHPDDPMQNKGIGPVKSITLGEFDQAMADEGQAIYELKCIACHKLDEKFVGPAPRGILNRRSPEWIMNMILNPEQMTREDPIARQLLIESNLAPMANQNLTEEEARKILEYFRTLD